MGRCGKLYLNQAINVNLTKIRKKVTALIYWEIIPFYQQYFHQKYIACIYSSGNIRTNRWDFSRQWSGISNRWYFYRTMSVFVKTVKVKKNKELQNNSSWLRKIKKTLTWPNGIYPRNMQGWFDIQNSVNAVHQINKLKKKTHIINK